MAPKSVTFRRHDHLVSVLFGDLIVIKKLPGKPGNWDILVNYQ